jgi:hypothetical protein
VQLVDLERCHLTSFGGASSHRITSHSVDAFLTGPERSHTPSHSTTQQYPCENNHTVNGILKIELGFQGFVFPREPHTVLQSSRLRNSITPILSPRLRCRPHGPQICEGLVFVTLLSSVSHYEHPTASRLGRHTPSMTVQLGRWPPRLAVFNTRIGDSLRVAHTMSL